jgi:hypothetical protein
MATTFGAQRLCVSWYFTPKIDQRLIQATLYKVLTYTMFAPYICDARKRIQLFSISKYHD